MQASAATAEALFSPITVSSQLSLETGQSPAPKWRFRFCFKLSPWQSTIMNGTFDWTSRSDNEWMIVLMIRLRWSSNQSCRKRPSARSIACSGSQVPTRVHTVVDVASTTDYCTFIPRKYSGSPTSIASLGNCCFIWRSTSTESPTISCNKSSRCA